MEDFLFNPIRRRKTKKVVTEITPAQDLCNIQKGIREVSSMASDLQERLSHALNRGHSLIQQHQIMNFERIVPIRHRNKLDPPKTDEKRVSLAITDGRSNAVNKTSNEEKIAQKWFVDSIDKKGDSEKVSVEPKVSELHRKYLLGEQRDCDMAPITSPEFIIKLRLFMKSQLYKQEERRLEMKMTLDHEEEEEKEEVYAIVPYGIEEQSKVQVFASDCRLSVRGRKVQGPPKKSTSTVEVTEKKKKAEVFRQVKVKRDPSVETRLRSVKKSLEEDHALVDSMKQDMNVFKSWAKNR